MAKGILFNVVDELPPTLIVPEDVLPPTLISAEQVDKGIVELTFKIRINNASIVPEQPKDLPSQGFLPIETGIRVIELGAAEINFDQSQKDSPVNVDITLDWPGGKIGGADAWKIREEKSYSSSK